MNAATLILLSGGKSSRMGRNKALLPVAGKANIKRLQEELQPGFQETILVTNHPDDYEGIIGEVKMVKDIYPGLGPLAGIHAGLTASTHELNLVVACDMPFVSMELAEHMLKQAAGYAAVIPRLEGRNQPLFGVYTKFSLPILEECLEEQILRVNFFLRKLQVNYLDEANLPAKQNLERAFYNMNHPEEYEQVQKWVKESNQDSNLEKL